MLHHPATREEWLKLRQRYVSSTESAALFGMSPYMTAFELATLKKSTEAVDYDPGERAAWGNRLQDVIAYGIADDYGVGVQPLKSYATSELCRLGASFDYEITGKRMEAISFNDQPLRELPFSGNERLREMFANFGPGVLEIKNVDWLVYKNQWIDGEAPAHIEIQVQHELEALDSHKWAAIGVLVGGNRIELLIRMRDREVGKAIAQKVNEFWALLDKGEMPPVTLPEDAEIIRKIYGYAEPGKVLQTDDIEIATLCEDYANAAQAEKEAKAAKESCQAKLLMRIGDAEKVLADGYNISAAMVSEAEIPAYTRKAYRGWRVTKKKLKSEKAT